MFQVDWKHSLSLMAFDPFLPTHPFPMPITEWKLLQPLPGKRVKHKSTSLHLQNFQGNIPRGRIGPKEDPSGSVGKWRGCLVSSFREGWAPATGKERGWVDVSRKLFFSKLVRGARREWLLIPAAWWMSHRPERQSLLQGGPESGPQSSPEASPMGR